jgi:hypothetical protein
MRSLLVVFFVYILVYLVTSEMHNYTQNRMSSENCVMCEIVRIASPE